MTRPPFPVLQRFSASSKEEEAHTSTVRVKPAQVDPPSMLTRLQFNCTYSNLATLPREGVPEIAFVGRSNAGKSSAINALAQQHKLAFVSKTPGRTQHFNYFAIAASPPEPLKHRAFLVDLPGYGFAKIGMGIKSRWNELFSTYVSTRQPLVALCLLMDIRHPLTPLDQHFLQLAIQAGRPLLVLLTKADKLGFAQMTKVHRETEIKLGELLIASNAALSNNISLTVMSFSILKRINIVAARQWIESALGLAGIENK